MVFNPDFSSKPILTGFYRRNLKPLDDKALKIIETNSHLIISEESRELIESYVEDRVSRTFMDCWKNGASVNGPWILLKRGLR